MAPRLPEPTYTPPPERNAPRPGPVERKALAALDDLQRIDPGPLNTTHRRRTGRIYAWNGLAPL